MSVPGFSPALPRPLCDRSPPPPGESGAALVGAFQCWLLGYGELSAHTLSAGSLIAGRAFLLVKSPGQGSSLLETLAVGEQTCCGGGPGGSPERWGALWRLKLQLLFSLPFAGDLDVGLSSAAEAPARCRAPSLGHRSGPAGWACLEELPPRSCVSCPGPLCPLEVLSETASPGSQLLRTSCGCSPHPPGVSSSLPGIPLSQGRWGRSACSTLFRGVSGVCAPGGSPCPCFGLLRGRSTHSV